MGKSPAYESQSLRRSSHLQNQGWKQLLSAAVTLTTRTLFIRCPASVFDVTISVNTKKNSLYTPEMITEYHKYSMLIDKRVRVSGAGKRINKYQCLPIEEGPEYNTYPGSLIIEPWWYSYGSSKVQVGKGAQGG